MHIIFKNDLSKALGVSKTVISTSILSYVIPFCELMTMTNATAQDLCDNVMSIVTFSGYRCLFTHKENPLFRTKQ